MNMPHTATITEEMIRCAKLCHECHTSCVELVPHCLGSGGPHADPDHMILLLDCAQICETSADFMLRGSEEHVPMCAVCSRVCEACADSCEAIDPRDEDMRRCAEMCRRCAVSCKEMSRAA